MKCAYFKDTQNYGPEEDFELGTKRTICRI